MSREVYTCLIVCLISISCGLAENVFDDAEYSGDYEPEITTFRAAIQHGAKKEPTIAPVTTTVPPPKKVTKETTTTKGTTTTTTVKPTTRATDPTKKSDLQNDINDFLDLIPADEVKEKFEEYYRNDMDVHHIYEYFGSKEFYELRKYVLDLQDVKEVLQYMHRKGCNFKMLVRKIGNRIGFNKLKLTRREDGSLGTNTTIGGLNGLVEDILAILPQDEIVVMFFEKLDKSSAFKTLVDAIGNPEFERKYHVLWNSKELHSAMAQLKKHRIDVSKIIQILSNYFFFGVF